MSAAELKELFQFLHDNNPQVRQIALSNLVGQTPKGSPHRDIFFAGLNTGGLRNTGKNEVIHDLMLLTRDQLGTAHDAFRALVNLSDNSILLDTLSEPGFLNFLVASIINFQSFLQDLASMLLSNLTASASTCAALINMTVSVLPDPKSPLGLFPIRSQSGTCPAPVPYPNSEPQEVLALPLLIEAFVQGAAAAEVDDRAKRVRKGDLHFLSSVFANLSSSPPGRMFFLTPRPSDPTKADSPSEFPLSKLLVFTEHKDTIRRGGVASVIKNCAFYAQGHKAMLSPETEQVRVPPSPLEAPGMDALQYILLPLAGPEEFELEDQELLPPTLQFLPPTKQREPDQTLRLTHVETLLLLCTTRWGRDYLRNHGVYEIIRALHASEKVDKVSEHIERLVNMLKRDEGTDMVDDDVETVEDVQKADEEEDDEDSKIEEI